jgi:hypothetical protein
MKREALRALKESIKKWENNVIKAHENKEILTGPENCPLCRLYKDRGCEGCPICIETYEMECNNTPNTMIEAILFDNVEGNLEKACKDEVKFLKSLLPKPKHKKAVKHE